MMNEGLLLGASYLYIVFFIVLAGWLVGSGRLQPRVSRKVVHIGVAHWWFFLMAGMTSPLIRLAGPVSFVGLNLLSLKVRLFKGMEAEPGSRNYGTVYFPISLVVLVLLMNAQVIEPWEAGVGVLLLGWGDGLAALIGATAKSGTFEIFGSTKSLRGSAAMLLASFAVSVAFLAFFQPQLPVTSLLLRAGGLAVFACLVELMTPFGIDNLTVPLLSVLYLHLVVVRSGAADALSAGVLGGFAFNAVVAWAAHSVRAVKDSGAVAGVAVGTALLASGGVSAYALLMAFFLSSTIIGRLTRKRRPSSGIEEKGDRRDAFQVLANCGAATASLLLFASLGSPAFLVAFAAGFAAANADTWASEIGILNSSPPRHLFTWKPLPAGTSGGVSPLGTFAALLGSVAIAAVFALGASIPLTPRLLTLIALGGFAGSLVDSALGAAFQAQYRCVKTGKNTERPRTANEPNTLVSGVRWLNNDAVNFLASTSAAAGAGLLFGWVA